MTIAPPELRELRELVRYRAKLVVLRSGLKAQVHATIAKLGVPVPMTDLFGRAGSTMLDDLDLPDAYDHRITSLCHLIEVYDSEIVELSAKVAGELDDHEGYAAIQAICGVGPILAAVFVAEIGDVSRFGGSPPAGVMVGTHAPSPRVRHHGAPRAHHQTRIPPRAVGGAEPAWLQPLPLHAELRCEAADLAVSQAVVHEMQRRAEQAPGRASLKRPT